MATKILTMNMDDASAERIRAVSDQVELIIAGSEGKFEEELPEAEVVIGELQPRLFPKAKRARWVAYHSAGIDHLMSPEIQQSDVIITTAKGFVGVHLAEHAFALILGLTRDVAVVTRNGSWSNNRLMGRELIDSTMGIIGLGGSGRETAKRAHAFGMRVLAVDPTPATVPDYVEACWGMDRFHDLLEASDVVVICAPLTPETEEMFNREAFRHMQSHALLINVSRGRIVNEEALVEALEQGLIGGAGLDTVPVEPLPDDHPLWQMENVVITPHIAGNSPMRAPRWMDTFCENLKRFMMGDDNLLSRFDQTRGY
jgi:phosphoglycerate dehydrogenase-like enzyme